MDLDLPDSVTRPTRDLEPDASSSSAPVLPRISGEAIGRLVADIDRRGFGTLEGYITPHILRKMQNFVAAAVKKSGGEYVGFNTREAVAGSIFDALAGSPEFQDLVKQVYVKGTGRTAPPVQFYQVLRCLAGQSGQKHSLYFHYDSYVVTVLIPVEIPTVGKTGDLIMLPNTRAIRKTYAANVVDKIFLDNKVTQSILGWLARRNWLPLTRIRPVPGNIYFFWGYRSIHTNEACDPDKVRATALYHYVNPHAGHSRAGKSKKAA